MNMGLVSEAEIASVVPAFYAKVRQDSMLGPIFNEVIEDWAEHLEKLQAFWSSVMLASGRYKGQPMLAHLRHEAQITPSAFARWLKLWGRRLASFSHRKPRLSCRTGPSGSRRA